MVEPARIMPVTAFLTISHVCPRIEAGSKALCDLWNVRCRGRWLRLIVSGALLRSWRVVVGLWLLFVV